MAELRIQNMKVGDKFVSPSRVLTATHIETFCNISGMLHPLFLSDAYVKNDSYCQSMGIKGTVAPGQLLLGIMLGNLLGAGLISDVIVQLGQNDIKFVAPAYPNDQLRTEVEVTDTRVTKSGDRVVVHYKWQLKNQDDVVVVKGENDCMFKKGS